MSIRPRQGPAVYATLVYATRENSLAHQPAVIFLASRSETSGGSTEEEGPSEGDHRGADESCGSHPSPPLSMTSTESLSEGGDESASWSAGRWGRASRAVFLNKNQATLFRCMFFFADGVLCIGCRRDVVFCTAARAACCLFCTFCRGPERLCFWLFRSFIWLVC